MHYYDDPHPYSGGMGGDRWQNSAAIAALELGGTERGVTLVHRGTDIHRHVKYWIKPDIENRIKAGEVTAFFNSQGRGH